MCLFVCAHIHMLTKSFMSTIFLFLPPLPFPFLLSLSFLSLPLLSQPFPSLPFPPFPSISASTSRPSATASATQVTNPHCTHHSLTSCVFHSLLHSPRYYHSCHVLSDSSPFHFTSLLFSNLLSLSCLSPRFWVTFTWPFFRILTLFPFFPSTIISLLHPLLLLLLLLLLRIPSSWPS